MKQVTAAVIIKGDRVLLAKRAADDSQSGKWEFPGGKTEAGETPEECLKRELNEELGIEASVGEFFARSVFPYDTGTIELLAYNAEWVAGEIKRRAHDEIRWVPVAELAGYDLAPADIPIRELLMERDDIKEGK